MRGRLGALVGGTALILALLPGGALASEEPWPSNATYEVALSTGAKGRVYDGTASVTFQNTGPADLDSVWLRLWGNGVFGCRGGDPDIQIDAVAGGELQSPQLQCTAHEVALDAAVEPGNTGQLSMDLRIRLPQHNDRFGWTNKIAYAGSALPVLAPEDSEGLHLPPYIDAGESFYAPVSEVEVGIESPSELKIAAAGEHLGSADVGGGRVLRTYAAQDVRDYAWAAGAFDRLVGTDDDGTVVRVHYVGGRSQARAMLDDSIRSLDELSDVFGNYPPEWGELDVVKSAFVTFGGMEYPSIIFSNPNAGVVAHEVGHQWWWGVVGNNSFGTPFLDEGPAEWSALWVVARQAAKSPAWCQPLSWPDAQTRLTNDLQFFDDHGGYGLVYEYGSCAISDLVKRIGSARTKAMLRDYVADHRFSPISTVQDFKDAVVAAGAEVPAFSAPAYFDRWRIGASS